MQPGLLHAQALLGSHRPPLFLANCIPTHASKHCNCIGIVSGDCLEISLLARELFIDNVLRQPQHVLGALLHSLNKFRRIRIEIRNNFLTLSNAAQIMDDSITGNAQA